MANHCINAGVRFRSGVRVSPPFGFVWSVEFTADSGLTLSGSNVVSWASTVLPGTYTATRDDPAGPVYSATSFPGSRAGVTFDGSAHRLACNAIGGLVQGNDVPWTRAIQFTMPAVAGAERAFCGSYDNTSGHNERSSVNSTPRISAFRGSGTGATVTTDLIPAINTEYVVVYSFAGTTMSVWLNGVAASGNPYACNVAAMNPINRFLMGCRPTGPATQANFWGGTMRRFAMRSGAVTAPEAAAIYASWYGT